MTHKEFLFKFLDILEENEIPYWLMCGTLLGIYRDKEFVEGDHCDTDIAIPDEYTWQLRRLMNKLHNEGTFIKYDYIRRKEISMRYIEYKYKMDIFLMERREDNYYIYSYRPNPKTKKWDAEWRARFDYNDFFPLKTIKWDKKELSIPKNTEKILIDHYGEDWKTPDPNWVSNEPLNKDHKYNGFYPAGINPKKLDLSHNEYKLGYICVNFMRPESTKKCIESLQEQYSNCKIYIADQDNPTADMMEFYETHNVEYYYMPFDCGLSYCRNFLIDKVQEPYIMWGDNDFLFDENNNIEKGIKLLENRKRIGVIGGCVVKNNIELHYERILMYDRQHGILVYIPLENTLPKKYNYSGISYYYCDLTFNYAIAKKEVFENDKIRWNPNIKVRYEHSIKGNQPIMIKKSTGEIEVIPIEDLFSSSKLKNTKNSNVQDYTKQNILVWTDNQWQKIKRISIHKCKERMVRLKSKEQYIECTEHHSLIKNNEAITPNELHSGDTLENIPFPELFNNVKLDLELAWLLGFFTAEGNIDEKSHTISITNQDIKLLKKAEKICNKLGMLTKIYNTKERKDKCLFLGITPYKLYKNLFLQCYTKKKDKKIPSMIFSSNKKARQAFFKGFYDGDGSKYDNKISISQKSLSVLQGLIYIMSDIYPNYYICRQENSHGEWFVLSFVKNNKWLRNKDIPRNTILLKEYYNYIDYVYDIETENHHFCGGIGNVNLHNSDFFLRLKEFSKYRVAYCPDMKVNHVHINTPKYLEFRCRKEDGEAFAEDWKLRMNFTIGKGREEYKLNKITNIHQLAQEHSPKPKLKEIKKQETDNVNNQIFVFHNLVSLLKNNNILFSLMQDTCLDAVKHHNFFTESKKIYIGIHNIKNIIKLLIKKGYTRLNDNQVSLRNIIINIEPYPDKTKKVSFYEQDYNIPLPVVPYLQKLFGKDILEK